MCVALRDRQIEQLACHRQVAGRARGECYPLDDTHRGRGKCLGGECVLVTGFQSENVSGQVEGADLAAAVVKSWTCARSRK